MDEYSEDPYNVVQRFIRPVTGGVLVMELRSPQQPMAALEKLKSMSESQHARYVDHYRLNRPVPFYISLYTTYDSGKISDVLLEYRRGSVQTQDAPDTTAIRAVSDWTLLLRHNDVPIQDSRLQWDVKVLDHCREFGRAGEVIM